MRVSHRSLPSKEERVDADLLVQASIPEERAIVLELGCAPPVKAELVWRESSRVEFVRRRPLHRKELRIVIPLLLAGQKLVLPRVLQRRAVGSPGPPGSADPAPGLPPPRSTTRR